MIYSERPENFEPKFEAVGTFMLHDGEIILLHRQDHKPQGNTWGLPSGRVEAGEQPKVSALRETREETGIKLDKNQVNLFRKIFVKFTDFDFVYHIFHATLDERPEIKINRNEHKSAKWISPVDALDLPLIDDLDGCIKLFFKI